MKIFHNKSDKSGSILTALLLAVIFTALPAGLFSSVQFDTWGISKDAVMKKYLSPGEKVDEFTPVKNPDYENKIMNMVKLILKNVDPEADKDITIISTKSSPRKDYLLFRNKLFSVMEMYNSISKEELNNVIKTLSKAYGEPNHNPGNDMDIYFISTKDTKIIVHYYIKSKKCEVYFYDSHLYHKLSASDF